MSLAERRGKAAQRGRLFVAADLFCGGGGFSKGFALACEDLGIRNVRLIAINHNQVAVETHKANHPWAEHHCARVDQLDPRKLVPEGRMKILIASPECTNHANARGGRPINDQSRATAWDVVKWAQELYIETILIENVREIQDWGPLGADGRPLKSKKGEIFSVWLDAIRRCGYRLEHRILNAADFGGATTRQRFFLIAHRGARPVRWPEQTHAKDADQTGDLFRGLKPWRGAKEVIDWSLKGRSIFGRKKPLARTTLARIEAGIRKFCGAAAEPFLIAMQAHNVPCSIEEPLQTITAQGNKLFLCEPFVLQQQSGGVPRSTEAPLPAIAAKGAQALVEPFLVQVNHKGGSSGRTQSVRQPLGAVTTTRGTGLAQPFIVPFFGERRGQAPRTHDVAEPLPAVTSHGAGGLVEPFLVKYHGTEKSGYSVRQPLSTVTSKDRVGLVEPRPGVVIDILFRMLEPHELARAMGFEGYEFTGSKKDKVRMIGNAVEVNTAKALLKVILGN